MTAATAPLTPLTPNNAAAVAAERDLANDRPPLQIVDRWKTMEPRRRLMLVGGMAAVLALLIVLVLGTRTAAMTPLFPGAVADKDAGAAIALLKQMEVPYKVADGQGGVILVPAEKAGELRMKMAAQGLPKGTVAGFELLDNQRFGQSPQQERTALQRALEGELTRSILSLSAVQAARVHLALPRFEGFYREQSKPSASVVVTLHPGRTLDRNQVAGIVHLVASSVPDLAPRGVSVIDQDGQLLSSSGEDGQADMTAQQRAHATQLEQRLLARVQEILDPPLGRDNLRATVTADIDFNQVETTSESYRPNQGPGVGAVRSQHTVEAGGAGEPETPAGVPGATSNQPPTPASAPITAASSPAPHAAKGQDARTALANGGRREQQTNYEVDRRVDVTRNASGTIRKLNVAVLVNHRTTTDAKGKTTTAAVPQEELDKLTALVQEAVGFSKDRGDSVKLVSMPFRAPPKVDEPPLWKQPETQNMVRTLALPLAALAVGLVLILAVIRPALRRPAPEPELSALVDDLEQLPGAAEEEGIPHDDPESPAKLAILADARAMARDNPLAVADLLRSWMQDKT